jgi:hypothetical protein
MESSRLMQSSYVISPSNANLFIDTLYCFHLQRFHLLCVRTKRESTREPDGRPRFDLHDVFIPVAVQHSGVAHLLIRPCGVFAVRQKICEVDLRTETEHDKKKILKVGRSRHSTRLVLSTFLARTSDFTSLCKIASGVVIIADILGNEYSHGIFFDASEDRLPQQCVAVALTTFLEWFPASRVAPHHGTVTVTAAEYGLSAPAVSTAVTTYLYVVPVVTPVSVNFNPLTGDVTSVLYPPVPTARYT